ncbi:ABC transporter related protein [Rhizobium sp. PDO1-076]|uniref:sugar ABC transporter ATP-binding protein n=1 Tax=Rhizobium sp. PDO1-076 TaxID=1125979 RepID=UPI00024E321F|nr:sugar ABC transporter ATP-binding protein [Rhizobium sp. PDO1-076]EHS52837.1 ABC transporter related protein [Rhizobium sp. PDO1-076]
MPLLQACNISRTFGSTRALIGASLEIEAGEIVALMGANGAGKSTLVKILSGVDQANAGNITLRGAAFAPQTPAAATAAGVVTVHQSTDVVGIPGLSVADALLLNRYVDGRSPFFLSRSFVRNAARKILDKAGFNLPLDRDFADLGAAERQLVAIARALADKAELLILDEPTASLSAQESKRLYEILLGLKARGLAILYISHRTADLAAIADRVEVLRGGRNAGSFRRPVDFNAAIETMIGRSLALARPTRRDDFGKPILELRSVRLLHDSVPFDLMVHAGEVVAVTGVLGAGKSRLLSALFGVGRLSSGEVTLEGAPYRPANPADAIARGVALAAEDRHRSSLIPKDWPGETIEATISLPHLPKWYPWNLLLSGRERNEALEAIDRLGIKAAGPDASIWSLSGGNQQKTVLARWEVEPGLLLLLDEPFQGVDVGARQDIIATIRSHRSRATLIATSDPEEAYEVADRVFVIDHHTLRPAESGAAHSSSLESLSA